MCLISLVQTRRLKAYRPILEGFILDFGYTYYHAILSWCGVLDKGDKSEHFWEVFIIKYKRKTIGICGLYSLHPGSTDQLWLGWFGVLDEYRNKNLGTLVLNQLEEKAIKENCTELCVYIDKNKKPLNFYHKNGFIDASTVGEYTKENGLPIEYFEDKEDLVLTKGLK